MLYLQIASPKSSVLNFLDSNSFEVIISIFQRTEKVPDMERLRSCIISIGISDIIIGTVSRMRGTLWYTMRYFRWNRRKVQLQDAEIIVSKKRSYEAAAG